tara:strand:- start:14655 stop:15134 length:480 start_codon:yes stop_codon:yes gene_type:complete
MSDSTTPSIAFEVIPYRKGGDAEQFSYTTKVYPTIEIAIEDLGQDVALDVLNAEVAARIGMRARNAAGFTKLAEAPAANRASVKNELLAHLLSKYPSKVIFSEDDARNWKPGVRELTLTGIQKKINEAYKSGNMTDFTFWVGQLQAAAQRQQERVAAGL